MLLDAALAYAARGWHVFPVSSKGKTPHGVPNGHLDATTDPDVIRAWFSAYPDANIGIALEPSGLVALDVDVSGEKQGMASLAEIDPDLSASLTAHTGSGGLHVLYSRPDGVSPARKIAFLPGLDLLGKGYIVAAPSIHPCGAAYRWHDESAAIAPLPEVLSRALVRSAGASTPNGRTLERGRASPATLAAARDRILSLGPAIEGQGGDALTYRAASIAVNDFALSESEAFAALSAWNLGNEPPWSDDELREKIRNAGRYATGEHGAARIAHETKSLLLSLPANEPTSPWEDALAKARRDIERILANSSEQGAPIELFEPSLDILRRPRTETPWRVRGLMTKLGTTMLAGGPKTSKTWAEFEILIACATGTCAFGEFDTGPPINCALFLCEDDETAYATRIGALVAGRPGNMTPEQATERLYVQTRGRSIDLLRLEDLALVVASCRRFPSKIDLVALDPLRDLHSGEEDSSDAMSIVMRHARAIGIALTADMFLVHHMGKPSADNGKRSGGQKMRGSGAIHGSVDSGIYIHETKGDCETHFINRMESQVKAGRSAGVFELALVIEDDPQTKTAIRATWKYSKGKRSTEESESEIDALIIAAVQEGSDNRDAIRERIGVRKEETLKSIRRMINTGRLWEPEFDPKTGMKLKRCDRKLYLQRPTVPTVRSIDPNATATKFLKGTEE